MVFGYLPKYAISINNTIKMSDLLIYKKKEKGSDSKELN